MPFAAAPVPARRRRLRAAIVVAGLAVLTAVALAGAIPPARAQDNRALVADMQVRMTALEEMVRSLTGQLEQAEFRTRQLEQRVDLLERELDLRLGSAGGAAAPGAGDAAAAAPPPPAAAPGAPQPLAPEGGVLGYLTQPVPDAPAGLASPPAPAPSAPLAGAAARAVLPDGPPEEQYQHAFALLRQGDYRGAEQAFGAFIALHPQHTLAGNAQYWLGETHYARGDYDTAAVAFAKGYKEYPDGSKTPDNLFKLGMSMSALGKQREACAAFETLRANFPNIAGALQRQVADQMRRNGC